MEKGKCKECRGRGLIWCPGCNGNQKMKDGSPCIVCKGKGLVTCYSCKGSCKDEW